MDLSGCNKMKFATQEEIWKSLAVCGSSLQILQVSKMGWGITKHNIETILKDNNQLYKPQMDSNSTVSNTNMQKVQKTQKYTSLGIATECTKTTNIEYLHHETKIKYPQ